MKVRDLASFIAFGVMIAVAIGYVGSLGIRPGAPSDRTDLSMKVADVNGLVAGSNVLLRGVPIGKVTSIASSADGATVDFYIGGQYRVPAESDVRLENLSALGETYIGLFPRSEGGTILQNGQQIATESVIQPASISELATSTVRVLNQLDPGALERLIGEVDTALPDPISVLPNLSSTSRQLRNTAVAMQGRGQELLDNFQTLLGNAWWLGPLLADLTPSVEILGTNVRALLSGVAAIVDRGAPEVLYKFGDFMNRIQNLLDNHGGDLRVLGEALQPKMKGMAGALLNFDSGQILSNLLAGLPEDGAIPIHVSVPPR